VNRISYLLASLALLNAFVDTDVATAVAKFDAAGPADTAASTVQRGPRVATSRAGLSPPLFLLPEPRGPKAHVKHPVRRNPNRAPAPAAPDPVLQSTALVAPTGMVPLLDFFGQGNTVSPNTINGTPPDTNGAVGPNHFVQTVNGGIAIWDKQGRLLFGSKLLNVLWTGYVGTNPGNQCATRNDGDPVVVYDQLADRWFISQFSVPSNTGPGFQCAAVSQTSDPTGSYFLYDFEYPAFNDYGKFGVWPDAYYASFNNFGKRFVGADLCAYDRASMLAGNTATQQCFQQSSTVFGVLPASLDGNVSPPRGEPAFFLNLGTNALNLWKLHVDFTTPANSTLGGPTAIPVAAFTPACNGGGTCIPEPGGGLLDSLAERLMFRLSYRNFGTHEALVVNHTVTANGASGIRWYEIRDPNGMPTVYQEGTLAPDDGNFRWMGSIAQDQAQDFLVGYSLSSSTIDPSIAWAGRLVTDPLGLMAQGEAIIDAGTGTETTASRWGDYSNMTVDPTDDCTFWYTQELYLTTGEFTWDTRIADFKFPSCGANDFVIGVSPSPVSLPQSGSVVYEVSTDSTIGGPETIVLNVQDLPAGVTGIFSPSSVPAGASSTLTLTAAPTAPPTGSPVQFTVIGTAPSALHATTAEVSVGVPPSIACPAPVSTQNDLGACGATLAFAVNATGSPAPITTCAVAGASILSPHAFPVGSSTVECLATNGVSPDAACTFTVTVADTQPPSITAPADIVANATGPSGVLLSYPAFTATDNCSVSNVTPAGSATFPINAPGTFTTVTGSATDTSGNSASASFKVHVEGAPEQTIDLLAQVTLAGVNQLIADVKVVQTDLKANKTTPACGDLKTFLSDVQAATGKKITVAQASAFTTTGTRIRAVLACK
jgi:hypothetical protein